MSMYKRKADYFESEEGQKFKLALREMASSNTYITRSGISADMTLYPDQTIPFVEKHMEYLRNHPTVDPEHYLSNLRLMTRVRNKTQQTLADRQK